MSAREASGPSLFGIGQRIRYRVSGVRPEEHAGSEVSHVRALRNEHLKRGVRPIRASIIDVSDTLTQPEFSLSVARLLRLNGERNLRFEAATLEELRNGSVAAESLPGKPGTSDIVSLGFRNCHGIVAVGKKKTGKKHTAFLTHHSPDEFVFADEAKKTRFTNALRASLSDLRGASEKGTIDAVIIGGNDRRADKETFGLFDSDYPLSVVSLSDIVSSELGFEPPILLPPTQMGGEMNVIFHTQQRILEVFKSFQLVKNPRSFVVSELPSEMRRWKENISS
ncbi:hypothetical protein K2P56_02710 [Patescibacteria group bacterium]|nr:hypothetical protein [Patescibacteria group bacterium]